jgi:superoxide dismutase
LGTGVMMFHHDRHHGGYVANLNGLITSNPTLAKVNLASAAGPDFPLPLLVLITG